MFEFSIASEGEEFRALGLLSFLEASPVLQKLDMNLMSTISLEGVAQGRIVTLPDIRTFIRKNMIGDCLRTERK